MMNLVFAIGLVLAGTASAYIEKRIVGSETCGTKRQYHVQITTVEGGRSCGGALLNTRWVITASHCAGQKVKLQLALNSDESFFSKAMSFLKGKSGVKEQVIEPTQQFTFQGEDQKLHDIMLIKLNQDMSVKVPTIQLPAIGCTKVAVEKEVLIGGYGAKVVGGKAPNKLKCASTNIAKCEEGDKPADKYASDEAFLMCASKPGVESCFGDGGTAVEHNNLLHGIIISSPADTCSKTILMLDICYYRQWIADTMRKYS